MKKRNIFVRISFCLALLLLVAAVTVGCGEAEKTEEATLALTSAYSTSAENDGVGKYSFTLTATFADGSTKSQVISTDEETVGNALLKLGIISGEDTKYGLTVYTVFGEEHDFNKDSSYWAIYVDGEYATSGIDTIKCSDVKEVGLKVEKS